MRAAAPAVQHLAGQLAARSARTRQNELVVARGAHLELIRADPCKSITRVEALGADVLGPDADPEPPARPLQPAERELQQLDAKARPLRLAPYVEPVQLAADRGHVRVRQAAGAGHRVGDRAPRSEEHT